MSDDERWIVIPNWKRFQHYTDRNPIWIKNHLELMAKDEYLKLSFHARGVLHGIWMEYAAAHGQLPGSTRTLSRRLSGRVLKATLESLNHAGFIEFSASKPSRARSRENFVLKIKKEERVRASERQGARPPAPEQKEQPRRPEQHERDELPERDPEAAAKIRALAAKIGHRIPSGRPDENGALDDDPFA